MLKAIQYYNGKNFMFNTILSCSYGVFSTPLFDLSVSDLYWWLFMLLVSLNNVGMNQLGKYLEKRIVKKNRVDKFKFKNFAKSKKGV